MRQQPLTALKAGINRLRVKGAASAQQLYDLLNGYINQDGGVVVREGTIRSQLLDSTTVGLTAVNGVFNVFSNALQAVPAGYVCNVLVHPTDSTQTVLKIWFAQPFMGFLYVVAEFANHDIFHYWLQSNGVWTANMVYKTGTVITPTVSNGLAYLAVRNMAPNPIWQPQTTIALNDIIEPTEYTGFAYKAIAVAGDSPHTGSIEPVWPQTENGTIQEFGDFSTSSSASDGTTSTAPAPLGSNITDRYGNSSQIAGQVGTTSGNAATVPAQTAVTVWQPGTTYVPGAVVRPSTNQGAFIDAIPNGDFENGDDGSWVLSAGVVYGSSGGPGPYQGTEFLKFTPSHNTVTATMFNFGVVTPGQSVTANAYFNPFSSGANMDMFVSLRWYTSSDTFISQTDGAHLENGGWRQGTVTGVAPANAAHVRVRLNGGNNTTGQTGYADLVTWNLEQPAAVSNFLYEAVQANAASSGSTEPTWPTVSGNTVIDGGVTWKAIGTSIITWEAIPITKSGSTEPTFPTGIGLQVMDGIMSWIAINRQVPTPNPGKTVALGASHVFNGDKDIVDYCAAVDPTDWVSENNAGYLPTGLNNYGANPVAMLALYRSNLMVFNSGGYQMWQIDPDPANMALLDAQPVGSIYPLAAQSVANDLLFLTEVGVRNLGTVGATANMQIGSTGQPVDPIVKAQLKLGTYAPISLYYPGRGQYWLIFGPQAFILTINGAGHKTWSRYVFPESITYSTLSAGILYMRTSGNKIWQLDESTLIDDYHSGVGTNFSGVIQWPYLDMGALGINKMMVGVDLVGEGDVTIQIGFDQKDPTSFSDNPGFATSTAVTPPYEIAAADTVPGEPIPIPLNAPSYTLILTWAPNQAWSWEAANIYLTDAGGAGATG